MDSQKISLMISTPEFSFTNVEIGFIKRNFQRKYPAVMSDFIDSVRDLMKAFQTTSKKKLTYNAFRYFPEGSERYHISETLSSVNETGQRVYISIHPVEAERKALFGANSKDVNRIDSDVSDLLMDLEEVMSITNTKLLSAITHNGLPMSMVVSSLYEFLKSVKKEIVVQSRYVSADDIISLNMDVSHKTSRSHYLKICFDFYIPPIEIQS